MRMDKMMPSKHRLVKKWGSVPYCASPCCPRPYVVSAKVNRPKCIDISAYRLLQFYLAYCARLTE